MMKVRKRNGTLETVNIEKITKSVARSCDGLEGIDYGDIAYKTVGGLYDGVTSKELDELSIRTAVGLITQDPIYSKAAARLLASYLAKEVDRQDINSFSDSIETNHAQGLISDEVHAFVLANKRKLNAAIRKDRTNLFEYYGLRIVYDRYLLRHPITRQITETPQYWLLRVACGLAETVREAVELYDLLSGLSYLTSTPTLFNSGTRHAQMSSCYLLDSPLDELADIQKRKTDIASLSKWAGGIGLSLSRVRGSGSLIKGTNGKSNGMGPFAHALSANVAAVNQGGKRKGAAAIYLETHHPDIMEFLELRDNTGDFEKRAYNLNLANWIPDLFMKRVVADQTWSLIDPAVAPELTDLFGEAYEARYLELEAAGKVVRQIPARVIYHRMMKTLAETGNGWMCWKDSSNLRCNTAVNGSVVHSSNLCTEILEPTHAGTKKVGNIDALRGSTANINVLSVDLPTGQTEYIEGGETAVCNLGSVNLSQHVRDGKVDWAKLALTVRTAVKYLDRVIDRNFYPTVEAKASNARWRPVGLGLMGYQDMLFQLGLPYESREAIDLSRRISEEVYYNALQASLELSKVHGPHQDFEHTHAAHGRLQFDLAGKADKVTDPARWDALREQIKVHGLRNSLLIAIAPTVTISAIAGCNEAIEPQISNMFKRETLTGEFVAINRHLINDLKSRGLWNQGMIDRLKMANGSVQGIAELPADVRALYKTSWEIKQKALIDHMVERGWFIDQSASLNLFVETPTIEKLSSMYKYAWEQGIRTTYYLRSRSATSIAKTVTAAAPAASAPENPDICESCT
jgi:ribonucleoside-diphosphate reductase alpha chain